MSQSFVVSRARIAPCVDIGQLCDFVIACVSAVWCFPRPPSSESRSSSSVFVLVVFWTFGWQRLIRVVQGIGQYLG